MDVDTDQADKVVDYIYKKLQKQLRIDTLAKCKSFKCLCSESVDSKCSYDSKGNVQDLFENFFSSKNVQEESQRMFRNENENKCRFVNLAMRVTDVKTNHDDEEPLICSV